MRRFALALVLPVLALLAIQVLPLVTGARTLYLRDVVSSHLPLEAAQAHLLRDGHLLPLVDPYRSGGQPLLGNPNALPLYPTKLLYAVAPTLWALDAHFWLHWLLAPFAAFWLGRAWGLSRLGAWTAGTVYAFSGFFVSTLNLYNLVAPAALTPALIAAALDVARSSGEAFRPRRGAVFGLVWALVLLGGDPMTAGIALLLALSAVVARDGLPRFGLVDDFRRGARWPSLAVAAGLGTIVAAPMLVEMARILPVSHRVAVPSGPAATLAQSVDPRSAFEWLFPLVFGDPSRYGFWGERFYGGNLPLVFSLAPGVLAFALVLAGGRPRRPAARWAWGAIGVGAFFALGWYNPLVRAVVEATGVSILRYPVKVWIAVAVPGALLAGVGLDRVLHGSSRRLPMILGGFLALYAGAFVLLARLPDGVDRFLRGLDPRFAGPFFAAEYGRWLATATVLLATSVALALGAVLLRRRPTAALALLLVVHAGSQMTLLAPLVDTDATAAYEVPPDLLALVPADARVVHGAFGEMFGPIEANVTEVFPDLSLAWQVREDYSTLGTASGIVHGRRYALNRSPERLDTYPSGVASLALRHLDDPRRVRLLAAFGVDRLLLPRPLVGVDPADARLLGRFPPRRDGPNRAYDLHVYALDRAVPPYRLAPGTRHAEDLRGAIEILSSAEHDPRSAALLPAEGASPVESNAASAGRVEIVEESLERVRLAVDSAVGGVVVSRRAWLPAWRAAVDGEPTEVELVDVHKLGVRVPPGDHEVTLHLDRRPTNAAVIAALLALGLLLVGVVRFAPRRRR